MSGIHKLCLRLNEENPREKTVWEKIKGSGSKQQRYLLEAVEAYEGNPFRQLSLEDIDRISNRILWRLEQMGYIVGIRKHTEEQKDIVENKTAGSQEEIMDFLEGL